MTHDYGVKMLNLEKTIVSLTPPPPPVPHPHFIGEETMLPARGKGACLMVSSDPELGLETLPLGSELLLEQPQAFES